MDNYCRKIQEYDNEDEFHVVFDATGHLHVTIYAYIHKHERPSVPIFSPLHLPPFKPALKFLPLKNLCYINICKVSIQTSLKSINLFLHVKWGRYLHNSSNDSNRIKIILCNISVNPIWNIQCSISSQSK